MLHSISFYNCIIANKYLFIIIANKYLFMNATRLRSSRSLVVRDIYFIVTASIFDGRMKRFLTPKNNYPTNAIYTVNRKYFSQIKGTVSL